MSVQKVQTTDGTVYFDVSDTPTNIIANGTITFFWRNLGDY